MFLTLQQITMLQAHATLSFPLSNSKQRSKQAKQVSKEAGMNTQASPIPVSVKSSLNPFYNNYHGNLTMKTLITSQQTTLA
jgi:hypothetical protein